MASQEVKLRAGESITLQLETAGRTYRLNLSLTEHGVTVTAPAEAKVEVHASAMVSAGARNAKHEPAYEEPVEEPVEESVEEPAFEPEQSVDIPASDEESSPVEVAEESHGMSDSEFSLEEESSVAEGTAVDFTSGAQRDSSVDIPEEPLGGADNLSLTGVPGVSHSAELSLDEPNFTEQGLTMVPPSRHSRQPQPEPEPEPLLESEDNAQPLDAVSATLSPVRFHDPATDNMEQPEMEEKRPPAPAPQIKRPLAGPAPRGPQPAPAAPAAEELPAWTGRARDYRDPKLEAKKAATSKLDKSAIIARQQAQPAPAEEETLDLALEEEPAPAPAKKPTAPLPRPMAPAPKPAPVAAKPMPAPAPAKPAPMAPKPAPMAAKPAPAPIAKAAPAPAAKPAPAAAAKADGNFTVFLSPPKGAEKKQAAAEIIADVQGIDINAATQLAGKMIVPVIKGVTEEEANQVRDRLKDAGLSCRITQKR